MDSFEINKIIAAVLVVVLLVFGIGKISDVIFHVEKPTVQGYKVEVKLASTSVTGGNSESLVNTSTIFGFLAIALAAINIFGGFLVTQRMLAMYKKKKKDK